MATPLFDRVQAALTRIQPMLGLHGGDIELVEVTEDGIARVRFLGACIGCAAAEITLDRGLKQFLLLEIDDLEDVEAVNTEPVTHAAPALRHA